MSSVHQRDDGRFYVLYRDQDGKQRKKSFGRNENAAKAWDLQLKADRILNKRPAPKSEIFLDDLAKYYIKDRRTHGASEKYIDELKDLLNNHWLKPKVLPYKPVDELTFTDMLKLFERYEKPHSQASKIKKDEDGKLTKAAIVKPYSQATKNRYGGYLRAIFRFGIRTGLTKNNPMQAWSKGKEMPRRTQLTVDDLKKILKHAAEHLRWGILVEWNIGTRPGQSELLALKWDQVDFEKGAISVYATKTMTWRTIPVSPEFMAKLKAKKAVAKTEYVIEYRGKPMKKFRNSFKTARQRAGLKYGCRMYDLRHLFATVMLAGGADLAAVSIMLGHKTIQQTANTYYELLRGEKEKAVGLLPSLIDDDQQEVLEDYDEFVEDEQEVRTFPARARA